MSHPVYLVEYYTEKKRILLVILLLLHFTNWYSHIIEAANNYNKIGWGIIPS